MHDRLDRLEFNKNKITELEKKLSEFESKDGG